MGSTLRKKNGNRGTLSLVSDDTSVVIVRPVPMHDPELIDLDNAMHTEYCRLESPVASRAIQEIRERRQFPWRVQARRDLELIAAGRPLDEILRLHDAKREWVIRTYWRRNVPRRAA